MFGIGVGVGILGWGLNEGFWVVGKVQFVLLEYVWHFSDLQVDAFA